MKQKTRETLKSLLNDVAKHEREDGGPDVTVDLKDLKRLLRWAQNKDYVWFEGDRVERTGVRIPLGWMTDDMQGTVLEDSGDDSTVWVEWDGAPEHHRRVKMFHNEVRRVKD